MYSNKRYPYSESFITENAVLISNIDIISIPQVDLVKGEAERQRLQREELELELLAFKEQMQNVQCNDSDVKRSD